MSTPAKTLRALVPPPAATVTVGGKPLALLPMSLSHYLAMEAVDVAFVSNDERKATHTDYMRALALLTLPGAEARALAGRGVAAVDLRAADLGAEIPVSQAAKVWRLVLDAFDAAFETAPARAEDSADGPLPPSPPAQPAARAETAG